MKEGNAMEIMREEGERKWKKGREEFESEEENSEGFHNEFKGFLKREKGWQFSLSLPSWMELLQTFEINRRHNRLNRFMNGKQCNS